MKQQTRWGKAVLIVALLMTWSGSNAVMAQTPVGAAFTYQGRLMTVSGLCDMSFSLYDEESGGAQIGATHTITDVVMTDGYFSVDPDFGAAAWNGDTRWLEVEATCPPGGSWMGFPRQVVRAVPYAMYALNSNAITSTVYVTETIYYTPTYHLQGWETITGTPASYTPTYHLQGWGTITGTPASYTPTYHLQGWGTITGTPASYTPTYHLQGWGTITGTPASYPATLAPGYLGYGDSNGIMTGTKGIEAKYNAITVTKGYFVSETDGSTGGFRAGAASDVLWYQGAANTWRTPDSVIVDGNVGIGTTTPYVLTTISKQASGAIADILFLENPGAAVGTYSTSSLYFGFASSETAVGGVTRILGSSRRADTWDSTLQLQTHTTTYGDNWNTGLFMNGAGNVGIGTITPNNFRLQVAGYIGPDVSNTYDLGSASAYWATIHYHTLTAHSLSLFSTTVTLQDGRDVSCLDALKEIRADPSKKIKGVQHMDYATLPNIALNAAPMSYNGSTLEKNGEDGADLDMMVSLLICAERELDAKNTALDNRMSDLEKRIAVLEKKVK